MSDIICSKGDFRKYELEILSVLQSFEKAREWADLSSCLQRLNRCISREFGYISEIPLKETVSKRLAQCLNPSLPSGVHIKALETYGSIFEKIGSDRLCMDLGLYASGLFPFFVNAATQVKPIFLDLIDKYFLPVGPCLLPCLSGLIVSLLPGVENPKSECYDRVMRTFQLISDKECIGEKNFMCTLWLVLLRTAQVRFSALEVIMSRFSINSSDMEIEVEKLESLITYPFLVVKALESCFEDENILVKRHLLDFLISNIPLGKSSHQISDLFSVECKVLLMRRGLKLLLLGEWSLTRRILQWISNQRQNISPITSVEDLDSSVVEVITMAILDELSITCSNVDKLFTTTLNGEKYLRLRKGLKNINYLSPSQSHYPSLSQVIEPIKIIGTFFEELEGSISIFLPKILISLLVFVQDIILIIPEVHNTFIEECKIIISSNNKNIRQFLDCIWIAFSHLLKNCESEDHVESSRSLRYPDMNDLYKVSVFFIDNLVTMEDTRDNVTNIKFLIDLLEICMKLMTEKFQKKIEDQLIFLELCLYIIRELKESKSDYNSFFQDDFLTTLYSFLNDFFAEEKIANEVNFEFVVFHNKLYTFTIELFNVSAIRRFIINSTETIDNFPFREFPIPLWFFNIYKCCLFKVPPLSPHFFCEHLLLCFRIFIEVFYNINLFTENNNMGVKTLFKCSFEITTHLWDLMRPDYQDLHKEIVKLLIDLEKWVIDHRHILRQVEDDQLKSIRNNSMLTQFFINSLSVYDIDLKISNIKKLCTFVNYYFTESFKFPYEVTFLILEGLDSTDHTLRATSSIWISNSIENTSIIFDPLLNELLSLEVIEIGNGIFRFKNRLDLARLTYTLDRLVTLITVENIDVLQIMTNSKIINSKIDIPSDFLVEDYLDAFCYSCVRLITTEQCEGLEPLNFGIQHSSINVLKTILSRPTFFSNHISSSKSFNFQKKLLMVSSSFVNPILETLSRSIVKQNISVQIPILQLLQVILLLQRSIIEMFNAVNKTDNAIIKEKVDLEKVELLWKNNKLIPILISGLTQKVTYSRSRLNSERYIVDHCAEDTIIKSYIDFCLFILEESLLSISEVSISLIKNICLELIESLSANVYNISIQYIQGLYRILLRVIGVPPLSGTYSVLSQASCKAQPQSTGIIASIFGWNKDVSNWDNLLSNSVEYSKIKAPSLIATHSELSINDISTDSKKQILENIIPLVYMTLVEISYMINSLKFQTSNLQTKFNFSHEVGCFNNFSEWGLKYPTQFCSSMANYVHTIGFILAWNSPDLFVYSSIICWSFVNKYSISCPTVPESFSDRNFSILSFFQLPEFTQFLSPNYIISIIGHFLSTLWVQGQPSKEIISEFNIDNMTAAFDSNLTKLKSSSIPEYILFFSTISMERSWPYCWYFWKESLIYHFLYSFLITYPLKHLDEYISLWTILTSFLRTFLSHVKQPNSILWIATILSTLDSTMASSKIVSSTYYTDKRLTNIFEDKKIQKDLTDIMLMIIYLVHQSFSLKIPTAVPTKLYDIFPLPPNIEAVLQSIKYDFLPEKSESKVDYSKIPKTIVSDEPNLLFSYYSIAFLIMYNVEVAYHPNSRRLLLRSIWILSLVKSLSWAFHPLIKTNKNVANMLHQYFLLIFFDTFPYRLVPDYLSAIRKPVIEALNCNNFFCMDRRTLRSWVNIISRLISQDITTISVVGRANLLDIYVTEQTTGIFSTKDVDLKNRCKYIKRLAFLIYCSPQNTFQLQLSMILEKLVENLKMAPDNMSSSYINAKNFILLAEQVLLCLRVLLLKVHFHALMPLWPIVLAELIKIFHSNQYPQLIVAALKFIDLVSLLDIPDFHLYQWIFVTDFFRIKKTYNNLNDTPNVIPKTECHINTKTDIDEKRRVEFATVKNIKDNTIPSSDSNNYSGKLENLQKNKTCTFSPFCNVIAFNFNSNNQESTNNMCGVDLDVIKDKLLDNNLRCPLLKFRGELSSEEKLRNMAKILDENCLLNTVQSPQIAEDELIKSLEDDFLDIPDHLLEWGANIDPSSLFSLLNFQQSKIKNKCLQLVK
ncbi:Dopey, N-terminal domain-containing protein [Cryptosporidium muris RN66]|uniref:Dopey, N-terminal domain-containing protein n=1 Tax=Cryptosporidium muris (strain RN66) TaxID=441375 RepID=B6AH59_CRYMR|nr:Dopey, N-terminal domain-containing protein [Cryptosporidium muris RN66]EEA07550.1 Dopey, N-terminal domain-containing protein [Cryptosporidium muris RN66]|eukprot:XP_002141899.1 Dopey, N-terminal domain-containing protein [Cryptosporidium muris RN66]